MKHVFKKISEYLENLPKSQFIMLYVVIIIAGISILYNIVPNMISSNNQLKNEVNILQRNIQISSISILNKTLKNNRKILLQKKENFLKLKEQTTFIMSQMYSLKFAFFNEREWISSLQKILQKSVNYGIEIKYVKNSNINKHIQKFSLIENKKNIEIEAIGKFANLVQYIHYIESLPILLKFNTIDFDNQKGKVRALLKFNTFGVKI